MLAAGTDMGAKGMTSRIFEGRSARRWLASLTLLVASIPAIAAENLWETSIGQTGFSENRSSSGQLLAGTESESSLLPGNVYNITFSVKQLKGTIGVFVGGLPVIPVDERGDYHFSFFVAGTGERRMMFQALSDDVSVRVNDISVTHAWNSGAIGTGSALPRGHYWSFDRPRNLNTEMVAPLQNPDTATNFRLTTAQNLHNALTTSGVRGFWMAFDWDAVEVGDGEYDWSLIDENMEVAGDYGLRFIVQISDRSFSEDNIMPDYFPPEYVIPYSGGSFTGLVAKRWDPYVYERLIRLYAAIAARYGSDPGFGGVATTETALGNLIGGDYSLSAYVNALIQIATQSQVALTPNAFLYYQNFLLQGNRIDMSRDFRVSLLRDVPHASLLLGAPDITPDIRGVVRSLSPYRIHTRKELPSAGQFCHLQHADQGHRGINVKDNRHRLEYLEDLDRLQPAAYEVDDVGLHPEEVLGELWQPQELLDFGRRNFDCGHVLWHYRDGGWWEGAVWQDIQQVILQNQDL